MSNVPRLVETVTYFHVRNLLEELAELQANQKEVWEALGALKVDLQEEWCWYTDLIRGEE